MIDIHSHILDGIDDGAKELQDSIEMARIAYMSGTKHMIATPHFITGLFDTNYKQVKQKVEYLNQHLHQLAIKLQIYPGQEVMLDNQMMSKLRMGHIGTLNDTQYMLIECTGEGVTAQELQLIDALRSQGIRPIIAHIERYRGIQKHRHILNELITRECYMQCNVNALNGVDGRKVQKWANELLELECIHLIASDSHSVGRRNPEMQSAIEGLEERGKSELINQLQMHAQCVLEGKDIPYRTKRISSRKQSVIRWKTGKF
ncbi:tyrosine-protein phosphatase [Niameybacter massiliensis]|uniref:tyrosine-protein phosphatase n=1 Tax=Niameybacter massiliensis TaxID=1658108 RepID=UPI0006B65DAF|nr:CpsB/CapC family capsule biosynthesis tyrosine phosphatase [Niameybacter massiliensis]